MSTRTRGHVDSRQFVQTVQTYGLFKVKTRTGIGKKALYPPPSFRDNRGPPDSRSAPLQGARGPYKNAPGQRPNRKWIMRFMEINEMPWRSREHPNDFITGLDVAITLQERPGSSPGDQMSTNGDSSGAPRRAGWSWRQLGASEALRGTKWPFHHSKRVVPTS